MYFHLLTLFRHHEVLDLIILAYFSSHVEFDPLPALINLIFVYFTMTIFEFFTHYLSYISYIIVESSAFLIPLP